MKISQREARRLKRRVEELERQDSARRKSWTNDWPGGVHLVGVNVTSDITAAVKTARKLGHAVVVTHSDNTLNFYACALPSI